MTELADIIKRESIAWWRLTLQDAFDLHLKLSSRVRELEADLKLSAKSYDANSKGWQADIAAAKERIKVLEKGKMPVWFTTQGLTDLDKVAKYIMQLQAALERMTAYYEAAIQGIVTDNSDDVLKQARDATGVK